MMGVTNYAYDLRAPAPALHGGEELCLAELHEVNEVTMVM